MKVKTFTGTHRATVDKQVNDWLAKSNVMVRRTNVAFKALKERGPDAIAGRTLARRGLGIAISIWYDEKPIPQSRDRSQTNRGATASGVGVRLRTRFG
jgi:predicted RNase H-like nuclease (RuvC/YqgF family)